MSTADFGAMVARHQEYFLTGATRSTEWRDRQLLAVQTIMTECAEDYYEALWKDLRRNLRRCGPRRCQVRRGR